MACVLVLPTTHAMHSTLSASSTCNGAQVIKHMSLDAIFLQIIYENIRACTQRHDPLLGISYRRERPGHGLQEQGDHSLLCVAQPQQ